MRLFEVEDRFASDLEMVLRNVMGRSNQKGSPLQLSYEALSNLVKNMGYGAIDYNGFQKLYDQNPSIQAIVKNFNDEGVEIATDVTEPEEQDDINRDEAPSVDQMASQGAKTSLNNPLA
jgi:hypothetical protein